MQLKTKPNGIFYLDYEGPDDTGKIGRRRISLDTRDRPEARRQMQAWMAGVHPKQLAPRIAKPNPLVSPTISVKGWTVRQALDRCLDTVWATTRSGPSVRSNMKIVNAYVGDELIEDMVYDRIERLIKQMVSDGYAPGTVKRKLDCLSKAVSMSSVWKNPDTGKPYISGKPKWPALKFDNTQDRELWPNEEAAMYEAIDKRVESEPGRAWWRFRCMIAVLIGTGIRKGEALVLDKDHLIQQKVLNDQGGVVTVRCISLRREETKSGKPRIVPLTPEVDAVVDQLLTQSGAGRWFPWKGSATPWYMFDNIREDMKTAGCEVDDVKLHTLRHTYANRLRRKGVALEVLQKLLGHHDISITAGRYLHIDATDLILGAGIISNSSPATTDESDSSQSAKRDHLFSRTNRAKPVMAHLQ